jgi:single-stranded-DNA-specific exonuclease
VNESAPEVADTIPWTVSAHRNQAAAALARELDIPLPIAALLVCRGLADAASARTFLSPSLDQLHAPGRMLGMQMAVERLRAALLAKDPILLYGDYDVDGTVATVLLKTAAERAAAAMGVVADVRYHIPHRIREGYGMQESRIAAAAAEGVRLVISVDTGIRAFAAAAEASRVGLDLIVTDHHLPDSETGVPEALAVLNPNQRGCEYPYKHLCGAGVAFKLSQALLEGCTKGDAERQRLREKTLPSFFKLLAIATIADAVPLTGENRVIAALGLEELRQPAQAGLRALMQLAQIDTTRAISASDIGFRLAPRINAAGRMDIASDVVELFLAKEPAAARVLAEKLHRLNDQRRSTEAEALRSIEVQIDAMVESEDGLPACLVLDDAPTAGADAGAAGRSGSGSRWHRGVIGILASRVVDRTGRPALVLAHENGEAYGSGRSIGGFHLLDALTAIHTGANVENGSEPDAAPLFSRFGGHAHAVGCSLASDRVGELRARLLRFAASQQSGPTPVPSLECDAEVRLNEITPQFLSALERLGPFGNGNPEPVFLSRAVRLAAALKVVKERHLRLAFQEGEDGIRFGAMLWGRRKDWPAQAEQQSWAQGDLFDVAYRLQRNWHPDFGGWEMEIVDIRPRATRGPCLPRP